MKAYVRNVVRFSVSKYGRSASRHRVSYGDVTGRRYVERESHRDFPVRNFYMSPSLRWRLQRNYKR